MPLLKFLRVKAKHTLNEIALDQAFLNNSIFARQKVVSTVTAAAAGILPDLGNLVSQLEVGKVKLSPII